MGAGSCGSGASHPGSLGITRPRLLFRVSLVLYFAAVFFNLSRGLVGIATQLFGSFMRALLQFLACFLRFVFQFLLGFAQLAFRLFVVLPRARTGEKTEECGQRDC